MSSSDRITINLRGHCLYCLGKIKTNCNNSPAGTPLSSAFKNRNYVHSLAIEERLVPFTVLCRYLGIELPDSYAFGDGVEPDLLCPELCKNCHDLSARLCALYEDLQDIQTMIKNTRKKIYQRVASASDQRGVLKREEFELEFKRKSKGSLSRGRGETSEKRKVVEMVKTFQIQIMKKDNEHKDQVKQLGNTFAPETTVYVPMELTQIDRLSLNNELGSQENVETDIPPLESLRHEPWKHDQAEQLELFDVCVEPEHNSELTTLLWSQSYNNFDEVCLKLAPTGNNDMCSNYEQLDEKNNIMNTIKVPGVVTRSQLKNVFMRVEHNSQEHSVYQPKRGKRRKLV